MTVTRAGDQGSHRSEAPADGHMPEKPDPIPAASRKARTRDGHPQMEASDPNLRARRPAPRNQAWTHRELEVVDEGPHHREHGSSVKAAKSDSTIVFSLGRHIQLLIFFSDIK